MGKSRPTVRSPIHPVALGGPIGSPAPCLLTAWTRRFAALRSGDRPSRGSRPDIDLLSARPAPVPGASRSGMSRSPPNRKVTQPWQSREPFRRNCSLRDGRSGNEKRSSAAFSLPFCDSHHNPLQGLETATSAPWATRFKIKTPSCARETMIATHRQETREHDHTRENLSIRETRHAGEALSRQITSR